MKRSLMAVLVGSMLLAGYARGDEPLVDPDVEVEVKPVYQKDGGHVIQKGHHDVFQKGDVVQKGEHVQKGDCQQKGGHIRKGSGHVQKLGHKIHAIKHGIGSLFAHHHGVYQKGCVHQKGGVYQKGGHVQK